MSSTDGLYGYTFELFKDAHDPKYGAPVDVPLYLPTEENFAEYGQLVKDYDKEEVWIKEWPLTGWRKMYPGTGIQAGITEGSFCYNWVEDTLHVTNKACPVDGPFAAGILPSNITHSNRSHILIRELNYHPDGGQVFYPQSNNPFVAVLALPGDDIKPEDVVAFYFDGSCGLQIKSDIWHTAMLPASDNADFITKQGKVHGCVVFDSVNEYGKYLQIPLKVDFAKE